MKKKSNKLTDFDLSKYSIELNIYFKDVDKMESIVDESLWNDGESDVLSDIENLLGFYKN